MLFKLSIAICINMHRTTPARIGGYQTEPDSRQRFIEKLVRVFSILKTLQRSEELGHLARGMQIALSLSMLNALGQNLLGFVDSI